MDNAVAVSAALKAAVSATRVELLRTELRVANTMMDLVAVSQNRAGQQRRVKQAKHAYGVVAEHVHGVCRSPTLSGAERRALDVGLLQLRARLHP
jgi:hypothetical protein